MTALAALSLVVWLVLVFARGGFWRIRGDLLPAGAAPAGRPCVPAPSVLVIVPARNEAEIIRDTLPFLLAQDYGGPFHVVLVDDGSEDGTTEAARRVGEASGQADRLTVLRNDPLPAGWTGKLWAMQRGVLFAQARTEPPDLLFFTDADIRHAPDILARLVALSKRRGAVLASLMVRLRAVSLAERLLVPAFVFFFRMLYPFGWVGDPARRTAAAAGGAMLVDRAALTRAGGLLAIRDALIDDCALGRLMKAEGPVWLGLTPDALSLRPYPRIKDIGRMVRRSAYAELRYSPFRLLVALGGLALVFFVPFLAALFASGWARGTGIAAWALMAVAFAPTLRFYRVARWTAALLPGIAVFYAWFTLDSALQHWRGRGGAWKGRVQAQVGRPAET